MQLHRERKGTRQSTVTHFGTVYHGGGCDTKCSSRVIKPICPEGSCERKNLDIDFFAKWNLWIINQFVSEKQILVLIMVDNEFRHSHRRACSLRGTLIGCHCHFSDFTILVGSGRHFLLEG